MLLQVLGVSPDGLHSDPQFHRLLAKGLVDENGHPLNGLEGGEARTIFESMDEADGHLLQRAFASAVERLIRIRSPKVLSRVWSRSALRTLAATASIVTINRGLYFTVKGGQGERENRRVTYRKAGIRLQFHIDTWNVYSSSALADHFAGHSRVAAILLLRSAELEEENGRSVMVLKATPFALGSGFAPDEDLKPLIAWARESAHTGPFRGLLAL